MDIIDLIQQKYQKILVILSELCQAGVQKRYTLFNQLTQEIELLAELEQQILYQFLRQKYPNNNEQISINEGEYSQIQQLIEELESFSPASKEFEQKSTEIHTLVERYTHEKVDKVLLEANKCLTTTERQQLAHELIERQDSLN